ncbi:MAG: ABC transporter permease [Phycicoccus sp.]|nr:ABC transporter permease [Phycicoccus sp.]NMM34373.1 ABC transporter permease [Phycicoccus sp.]
MTLIDRTRAVIDKRQVLWTLVVRDLRVRYSRSILGYVWTVLDPLLMSSIYFVVFVFIFKSGKVGQQPYFLFLVIGLLSWQWFSGSLTDTSRALLADAKLIRSTNLPREIWVVRVVIAKGVEYVLSLPVLAAFTLFYALQGKVHFNLGLLLFPVGLVMEFVLLIGLGLLLAPITALVTDMARVIKIVLRMLFYLTPVLYAGNRIPAPYDKAVWLNPMTGVLEMLRAGFFDQPVVRGPVILGAVVTVALLFVGAFTFSRLERSVLKEI